jgi:hypothetical protein
METQRKFYKTVIQVTILSEEPFSSDELENLETVNYEITEGGCSGVVKEISHEELTGKQAAEALQAQGSDPELFQLTEDGEDC